MKKTKIIIPALGVLLLSTAASVTGTVAWFSANSTVKANGMRVKAKAESALVISETKPVGTLTEVNFESDAEELVPATHNSTVAANSSVTFESQTGLNYNTNPSAVNPETGLAFTGTDATALAFAPVITDDLGIYAVDYVVFIAAAGEELVLEDGDDLNVKLSVSAATYANLKDTSGAYDTLNALTVDFYVSQDTEATGVYAGSLNLKSGGLSNSSYDNTTALTLLKGVTPAEGSNPTVIIPKNNKTDDYLKITMRVYFDGALEKTSGQAYVYSDIINTSEIQFNATFKVE